jgi:hypothetical protein
LDLVQGGYYDTQLQIKEDGKIMFPSSLLYKTSFSNVIPNHAFIPSASALALRNNPNRNWADNVSSLNLTPSCANETPFDSYYAPTQNEEHVYLSAAGADFVKKELNRSSTLPIRTSPVVSGSTNICPGQTATYTYPTQGTGAVYTWTVQNLNIISGQNTNTIQVQAAAGTTGNRSVELKVTTPCFVYQPPQIVITSQYSGNNFYVNGPSSLCPGQLGYFSLGTSLPDITQYQWIWPSDWTYFGGQNTPNLDVRAPYNSFGSGQIVLRVGNNCGLSEPVATFVMENTSCNGMLLYEIAPNPANDYAEVTVKKKDKAGNEIELDDSDKEKLKKAEVKLYKDDKLLLTEKFKENKAKFNTSEISNGIYIINIVTDEEIIQEQLVIAH